MPSKSAKTKACAECKKRKKHEAFCRDKSSKDGLLRICRECDAAYQKAWRAKRAAEKAKATTKRAARKEVTT